MGIHESYRRVSGIRRGDEQRRIVENKEKSKIKLSRSVKKKFETCFIGCINSIEDCFGDDLWGRDLDRDERTPHQVKMLRLWLELRSEILDKGNAQLRGMLRELEDYEVEYQGKKIIFTNGDGE